jgi:hypothetical protein
MVGGMDGGTHRSRQNQYRITNAYAHQIFSSNTNGDTSRRARESADEKRRKA